MTRWLAAAAAAVVIVGGSAFVLASRDPGPLRVETDAERLAVEVGDSFEFAGDDCWVEPRDRRRVTQLADRARTLPGVREVVVTDDSERGADGTAYEVFLDLDVDAGRREEVRRALAGQPDVGDVRVRFVDRDEQYELFREYFRDEPESLRNVRVEDLPESFRVATVARDAAVVDRDEAVFTARAVGETAIVLENVCPDGAAPRVVRVAVT